MNDGSYADDDCIMFHFCTADNSVSAPFLDGSSHFQCIVYRFPGKGTLTGVDFCRMVYDPVDVDR